jgi:hypothetical protein
MTTRTLILTENENGCRSEYAFIIAALEAFGDGVFLGGLRGVA